MTRLIGILCFALIVAASCTRDIAGTGNGSETTNGIVAAAVDRNGMPAAGASVKAAPNALTPGDSAWTVYETRTDSLGRFRIESMARGIYALEIIARDGAQASVTRPCAVADTMTQLGPRKLSPTAILCGAIAGAGSATHTIYIEGLDRTETTLSSGLFSFGRLAAGHYNVVVRENVTHTVVRLENVALTSGEIAFLDQTDPASGAYTRRAVDSTYADSLAVVRFLHNQGIAESEWAGVVTIAENSIEKINLSARDIARLHPSIGECRSVHTLRLDSNRLIDLPYELARIPSLYELGLDSNRLSVLPEVIPQLRNLYRLDLENNNLSQLPASFGRLTKLETIILTDNNLSEFPHPVCSCTSLRWLKIYQNDISSLPDALFAMTTLEKIGLSHNPLDSISSRIGNLINLRMLDIAWCGLARLPDSIGACKSLSQLWATHNQFQTLPASITRLDSLRALQVSHNNLVALPEDFGALNSLEELFINGNQLTALPVSITSLQSLGSLLVGGNSICDPSAEINAWLDTYADADWRDDQIDCE